MSFTNRRKVYPVAMVMVLTAACSGTVYAEESQAEVKESVPVVDSSKVAPQTGAEQKKASPGQVSDLLRAASPSGLQLPAGTPEAAGSSLTTSGMPVPSSSSSSSSGGFFSSLGSFLQNLVRVDVRDKGGKANVDVKAPFVDVQDAGKGANVNVKAPFVDVQDAGKGANVNVKAPFVDVQGKGNDANVNVNAPFVDVHVNKGQSKVRVKTPFFELNK